MNDYVIHELKMIMPGGWPGGGGGGWAPLKLTDALRRESKPMWRLYKIIFKLFPTLSSAETDAVNGFSATA